jgi:hypothetical protein
MSLGYFAASEVQESVLVADGRASKALVEGTIAVDHDDLGPVGVGVLGGVSGEDTL